MGRDAPNRCRSDPDPIPQDIDTDAPPRRLVALLFADFKGFSRLDDHGLLAFHRSVMTRVAVTFARL